MNAVCINAVSTQAFWQLPDALAEAVLARLPAGWTLVVARTIPELTAAVKQSRIALGWPFPAALARGAKDLRWVHFFTAGVPESWQAPPSSLRVTTQRGGSARSVAEHALFLMTASLRGVTRSTFSGWTPDQGLVPRAAEEMRAAIFGFGAVGRGIAALALPLFGRVTAVVRDPSKEFPPDVACVAVEEWAHVLDESEAVFLALPLTAETRALTGPAFFGRLRPDTILVNVASGILAAEPDILGFLAKGPASRYAADVAHPEPYPAGGALYAHDQVLLTPHIGARREDAWAAITKRTLDVLDEALAAIGGDA